MIGTVTLWGLSFILAGCSVAVGVFVAQVFGALFLPARPSERGDAKLPGNARVAVLMPAHNEEAVLGETLGVLLGGAASAFRTVVVADNCTDDTAAIARMWTHDVVERTNPTLRGKGYALQAGLDHLRLDPPDVVIVLDADCRVSGDQVLRLASVCMTVGGPVQSVYLMHAKSDSPVSAKVSELAWLVKTFVRALGWYRLTGSCGLSGSGMAFPWALWSSRSLASGHLVEDLQLTVDLAKEGVAIHFCPDVRIDSTFPTSDGSRAVQSTRWEHGHLDMITHTLPGLIGYAARHRCLRAFTLGLDMLVPPLSLLVIGMGACTVLAWGLVLFAGAPVWLAGWATLLALLFGSSVAMAWWGWGRQVLTAREMLQIPAFIGSKLGIYRRFVTKRETNWNRADRE